MFIQTYSPYALKHSLKNPPDLSVNFKFQSSLGTFQLKKTLGGVVSFIGIMYGENKQVQTNFIGDTYVHKLGWYGSGPQAGKILDDENHKIWNTGVAKEVVCATKDSQGYLEANPERKNYGLIFKNNGSRSRIWNEHRLRYSNSQYDIASILLL